VTDELQQLLKETSRSFYLTVRVLPAPVRSSIGIAYLLARATDTVADTELVPVNERLATLNALRQRILGTSDTRLDCTAYVRSPSPSASPGERRLLERLEAALHVFEQFPPEEKSLIRQVLDTITGGQELDLRRFGTPIEGGIPALPSAADLDDYTYRVAGCVGEFWTRLTLLRCFPSAPVDSERLLIDGVRFGCGLQLVNILRDLPKDLSNGRCYLPHAELQSAGLLPGDLVRPEVWPRLKPVYDRWWNRAMDHLNGGWAYTQRLPRQQVRLRLACAWPVLLGVATLAKLATANPLDARQRVKVHRAEVRQILVGSLWRIPFPNAWNRQFENWGGRPATAGASSLRTPPSIG
jgi:farnesyl-diphosphate farnesyltransferase